VGGAEHTSKKYRAPTLMLAVAIPAQGAVALWPCICTKPQRQPPSSRVWFFKERLPAMKVARLENLTRAYACMGKGWSATKHA
jgi:hypothetical protein